MSPPNFATSPCYQRLRFGLSERHFQLAVVQRNVSQVLIGCCGLRSETISACVRLHLLSW